METRYEFNWFSPLGWRCVQFTRLSAILSQWEQAASAASLILTNPYCIWGRGGGQIFPCDAKISEKCLCSHHHNTALMKQIFLFNTALVMTNSIHLQLSLPISRAKQKHSRAPPPSPYNSRVFYPTIELRNSKHSITYRANAFFKSK